MKRVVFSIITVVLIAGLSFFFFKNSQNRHTSKTPTPPVTPTIGQLPMQTTDEILLGEITEVTGRHFTLSVDDKYYDIVLADRTFFKRGKKADIVVGKNLGVIASNDKDGTYIARTIVINASSSAEVLK